MSIKKKVELSEKELERKRAAFIAGGGDIALDKKQKIDFSNILIRVPNSILEQIDECIKKKPWMNRTQWLLEAAHEKLENI